jgi:DNA-binding FadR family transcriptional regulator
LSLVDEIAARLQRDILDGSYQPEELLPPERELAERYGVTRTSLKHALVRLEALGLIRTQHGIGSVVQDVSESGGADLLKYVVPAGETPNARLLREILEVRTFVAAAFVRLAARRRTGRDLGDLEALIARLSSASPAEAQKLENQFFRALARSSGNRAVQLITNSVSAVYHLDPKTYAEPFKDGAWLRNSLSAILAAVRAADEERARRATERYFDEAARRVLARRR